MATTALPVVDLAQSVDQESKLRVSNQLVDALKTVGFLYIDSAPGFDEDQVKKWCLWFFNLPEDTKVKLYRKLWNPESKNVYRGVFPVQKGETSYKEGFEIGNENQVNRPDHPIFGEGNVWPDVEGVDEFKEFMISYFDSMMKTSLEVCHLMCLGLGLREDWFDATFVPNSLSTLRLIHYPVRTEAPPPVAYEDGVIVCCADHSDSGFLTLLTTFDYPGLQIKLDSGKWMDVPHRHNSLVMNIGDMLSRMTNGYLRATKHRVLDPMVDRFSVPFFLEPAYDADVGYSLPFKSKVKSSNETENRLTYGNWLLKKLLDFAEYRYMINSYKLN